MTGIRLKKELGKERKKVTVSQFTTFRLYGAY